MAFPNTRRVHFIILLAAPAYSRANDVLLFYSRNEIWVKSHGPSSARDHRDDLVCLFSSQTDRTGLNNVITIVQSRRCVFLTGQTGGPSFGIQAGKALAHKNKQSYFDYPLAWKRLRLTRPY